ncbi:integrase [Halobacteriales archaeon QS_6_64_34]|nr:MAG: integrase [Halobacteriales archaeon QS_6_64_34]
MTTPRDRVEALRERIKDSGEIGEQDHERLIEFSDRLALLAQDYSDHRHEKLLRHCTILAENLEDGTLTAALKDREAAETAVGWINRNYTNEETNRDYRSAIRVFGKRVAESDGNIETDSDRMPPSLAWIPTGTSSDYDPSPDPRNMLRWEDHVVPMIDAAYNARDAAMIALQFDAGLRSGEFKSLRVGDLQDHEHGLQVTGEGKQGRRTVMLIPSVPHVNRWLDAHPDRHDDDAPLWSKLHEPEGLSDRMVSKAINKAAERVDVSKPVTLTNFRKSSAAFLASRNLNQAHIEDHHGWVRGSKAAARYISVFGEDSDREIARLHGVDVSDEEPDNIAALECTRCGRETPRHEPLCMWCGQAMDPQAAVELEESTEDLRETLASLPSEKAERILEMADLLNDPEIKGALLDSR